MKKLISLILVAVMLLSVMPMAYAEGNNYKTGDIIQFGSYPQSEVEDKILINELNALAPEWDEWVSYEYYSGTGDYGTMVPGDWMRYIDIIHGGKKYRGVKFTEYRPTRTIYATSQASSMQSSNGYYTDTIYWFNFEPLDWRVLSPDTGLVICENLIDSQPYNNTIYQNENSNNFSRKYFNDSQYTNYANDYETSTIRKWLNNDFYNAVFTEEEKGRIHDSILDNNGVVLDIEGREPFKGNSTVDKIFLLSDEEAFEGFDVHGTASDNFLAKATDYAKVQGISVMGSSTPYHIGISNWILRTQAGESDLCAYIYLGCMYYGTNVTSTIDGIRPALKLNAISNNCSCKCHRKGLMSFWWKLLLIIFKICKINQICACGVAHY